MATTRLAAYNEALRQLGEARIVGLGDDVESRYALDAAWDDVVLFMLRQAAWRFATTSRTVAADADGALTAGYSYRFTIPGDWLYTHSIFALRDFSREVPVDVREERGAWYSNLPALTVRYVSEDYVAPEFWTDSFQKAVCAYLAWTVAYRITGSMAREADLEKNFASLLDVARTQDALPSNAWLRHQFNGTFIHSVRYVLEHGMSRSANKTVLLPAAGYPLPGYSGRFSLPADWLRTISVEAANVSSYSRAVPFHEENGGLYTQAATGVSAAVVRYISIDGFDSGGWPETFYDAVLAHLELMESKPSAADVALFKDRLRTAENRDAYRDNPRINHTARVVRARYGGGCNNGPQGGWTGQQGGWSGAGGSWSYAISTTLNGGLLEIADTDFYLPATLPSVPAALWNDGGLLALTPSRRSVLYNINFDLMVDGRPYQLPLRLPEIPPLFVPGVLWNNGGLVALTASILPFAIETSSSGGFIEVLSSGLQATLPEGDGVLWNDGGFLALTPSTSGYIGFWYDIRVDGMTYRILPGLSGEQPLVAGVLWNDGGLVAIS